jgi:hypothetical protein
MHMDVDQARQERHVAQVVGDRAAAGVDGRNRAAADGDDAGGEGAAAAVEDPRRADGRGVRRAGKDGITGPCQRPVRHSCASSGQENQNDPDFRLLTLHVELAGVGSYGIR